MGLSGLYFRVSKTALNPQNSGGFALQLIYTLNLSDPIYVIMEYINGSTLQEFLRKSRSEHHYKNLHGASQSLSSRDLTSFAYQVIHFNMKFA